MTSMQSDPVLFDCVKTECSLAHYKRFPREGPFQRLSLAGLFFYLGVWVFYVVVFRLCDLPVVATANCSLEQDGFKWSCQISHGCKHVF